MTTKRKYDRAFKERVVKLSYERSSITELASELGVLPNRIYSWRKEFADYGSASFPDHAIERLCDDGRRVKELEKKLKTTELKLGKSPCRSRGRKRPLLLQGDFRRSQILKKAIDVF